MKGLRHFLKENDNFNKGFIKLVFVGDIMQHKHQLNYESSNDFSYEGVFDDIKHIFESADMVVGNLETTFSGFVGNKINKNKLIEFSANDKLAYVLKDVGFTHLSVANNHILDNGIDGYKRTTEILETAGIQTTKIKKLYDVGNYKIELYNFTTHINKEDNEDLMNSNIKADSNADFNIAFPHWGWNYTQTEDREQTILADDLSDNGYNIIVGSGPHEVHKLAVLDNSVVAYSLGDFLADHNDSRAKDEGLILSIEIDDSLISKVITYNTKSNTINGKTKIEISNQKIIEL